MLVVCLLWTHILKLWVFWIQEPIQAVVKLLTSRVEGRPLGQTTQCPNKSKGMITLRPVVSALVNGQEVPCLIDTESEVTFMEYYFYVLDPCWLNNLPILVEGIT